MQRFSLTSVLLASLAVLSSAQYTAPAELPTYPKETLPATLDPTIPTLPPLSSYSLPTLATIDTLIIPSSIPTGPEYPTMPSVPTTAPASPIPSSSPASTTMLYVPTTTAPAPKTYTESGYAKPTGYGNATTSGVPPMMTGAAGRVRGSGIGSLGALLGFYLAGLVL
ncbi:unnamed protein product [Diplocarpon coronariae]|uniref:Uncharacterized protein n=1 Tax=Diplocarpon coronariae TaxID=2795749 RepID=A0A218Z858_9HELO|nr:hypothetical protein B2J93_9317 [Marssonina coronariae]